MSSSGAIYDVEFKPARIIFFIRKNKEVNEVYYVIDLTDTMYESITAKSWRTPITTNPCEKFSYQKKKLCMTLNNQGPWKRDIEYDTRHTEEKKTFALQLIDSMLKEVNQQQTADQASDETALPTVYLKRQRYLRQHENPVKRMEYLHLRDKINVWPPESLGFMFYYLKNDVEFDASQEPGINPVLTSWLEQLNYPNAGEAPVNSGGIGMGIRDFEEGIQDGMRRREDLQSGVILYRGPKVTSPDPAIRDEDLTRYLKIANEFNGRRVKNETQIILNIKKNEQLVLEKRSAFQKRYPGTIVPSITTVLHNIRMNMGRGGKSKRVKRVKRSKRSKTCKNRVHKRRN
jgi:hypothetical protein